MISFQELNPKGHALTSEQYANSLILHHRVNFIRAAYTLPLVVTSGFRTPEEHAAIYLAKGNSHPPQGSAHLSFAAADLSAADLSNFKAWILDHLELMEQIAVYFEAFDDVPRVHVQIYCPPSLKRFFLP